jgi:uncharacterized protein (TIGR02246 family)
MNDLAKITTFAKRYVEAWCSQNPESVAALFAESGSLSVNDGPPAVGRAAIVEIARGFMRDFPDMVRISGYELWKIGNDGLIGESKGHFDSAQYEKQIKEGLRSES